MSWFKREKKSIDQATPPEERRVRTEGLWVKCESCRAIVFRKDLEENLLVCPKCQFHFKMNSKQRLALLLDGRWTEHDAGMVSSDPLKFVDTKAYAKRIKDAQKKTGNERCDHHGGRSTTWAAGDLLRDGIWIYRRLDGGGGWRKSDASD